MSLMASTSDVRDRRSRWLVVTVSPTRADPAQRIDHLRWQSVSSDPAELRARQALYRHEVPFLDVAELVEELLRDTEGVIVDGGCGDGTHLARLVSPGRTLLGVDLAPAMLARVPIPRAGAALLVGDLQALPIRSGIASAGFAAHSLYLTPDPLVALGELCRTVRPGGLVVVVTPAADDKDLLRDLLHEGLGPFLSPAARAARDLHLRFDLDAASAVMGRLTREGRTVDLVSQLCLGDVAPLLAYLASLQRLYVPPLTMAEWRRALARMAGSARSLLDGSHAVIRIPTHLGAVVGRA
jgi:SAM-dependent methyltransferase